MIPASLLAAFLAALIADPPIVTFNTPHVGVLRLLGYDKLSFLALTTGKPRAYEFASHLNERVIGDFPLPGRRLALYAWVLLF